MLEREGVAPRLEGGFQVLDSGYPRWGTNRFLGGLFSSLEMPYKVVDSGFSRELTVFRWIIQFTRSAVQYLAIIVTHHDCFL